MHPKQECAYQEKDPPFRKHFDICKISDDAKLIKYNSSKKETKYLKTSKSSYIQCNSIKHL